MTIEQAVQVNFLGTIIALAKVLKEDEINTLADYAELIKLLKEVQSLPPRDAFPYHFSSLEKMIAHYN